MSGGCSPGLGYSPWEARQAAPGELRSQLMSVHDGSAGVLYVIVCGAPAASSVDEFIRLAQDAGWLVRVVATPMGERFIDAAQLAALTGDRVRTGFRMPDEPDELPAADAVVVAQASGKPPSPRRLRPARQPSAGPAELPVQASGDELNLAAARRLHVSDS